MFISQIQAKPLSVENSIYPLYIQSVPSNELVLAELGYRLIHQETRLQVPGHFTQEEAKLIQKVTQHWNWHVDKNNRPACATGLLHYLEQLCECASENQEVAL